MLENKFEYYAMMNITSLFLLGTSFRFGVHESIHVGGMR